MGRLHVLLPALSILLIISECFAYQKLVLQLGWQELQAA